MKYEPKTAEQIFLTNVFIRAVELHLLRRKVRAVMKEQQNLLHPLVTGRNTLEKLDNRIELLTRQCGEYALNKTSDI